MAALPETMRTSPANSALLQIVMEGYKRYVSIVKKQKPYCMDGNFKCETNMEIKIIRKFSDRDGSTSSQFPYTFYVPCHTTTKDALLLLLSSKQDKQVWQSLSWQQFTGHLGCIGCGKHK